MHKNKTNRQRRQFCISVFNLGLASSLAGFLLTPYKALALALKETALYIPPLIDSREHQGPIQISIQKGFHEFVKGKKSATLGYNGNYLGPTIRLYDGDNTQIQFTNNMDHATSVHGHGLHVPGDVDGGPQIQIAPAGVWDVRLPIRQQASTNWYHPHLMGSTAEQVHAGLAGLYIVEDKHSQSLPLPNTYAIDDIPIIIQDRNFQQGVMTPYPKKPPNDLREDTLVINGCLDPVMQVPAGLVRLRLLNGANGRAFKVFREDGKAFHKIATEGGLLESPVVIEEMIMSPGERNEIVIDLSSGGEVALMATLLDKNDSFFKNLLAPKPRMLRLRANPELAVLATKLPEKLNNFTTYDPSEVVKDRRFKLKDMAINGVKMDMNVINETVKQGELERWTIDSGRHPFHMHGAAFQILSINGKPPTAEHRGWKDTITPRGEAEILLRFEHLASAERPYMYHCHILEHEDLGMMGQFTVEA